MILYKKCKRSKKMKKNEKNFVQFNFFSYLCSSNYEYKSNVMNGLHHILGTVVILETQGLRFYLQKEKNRELLPRVARKKKYV